MKNLSNRIKKVQSEKGWTNAELARQAGVTRAAITDWLNGRVKNMTAEVALRLSENSGFVAMWLATGQGEMMLPDSAKEPQSPSENEYSLVPIIDVHAACGNGHFNDQALVEGSFALPKVMLHDLGIPEGQGRIIHAKGNSMAPTIQDEAVVLINLADKEPKDRKVYAICLPHEGLVLKRLIYEFNDAAGASVWIMRSDNPDKNQHPDKRLPPDESTIIAGRAVWYGNRL